MDLPMYLRVIWRFRLLVGVGLILAALLTFVSTAKVAHGRITYRQHQTWISHSMLMVTQPGFPNGRAVLDDSVQVGTAKKPAFAQRYADPNRLISLALIYAQMVSGDSVRRSVVAKDGPLRNDKIAATTVTNVSTSSALPIVDVTGVAGSRERAITLARDASAALQATILSDEESAGISPDRRVELNVIARATPLTSKILTARSMTRPVFIFLLILTATIALAFLLENARPRIRRVASEEHVAQPSRASA
jgi:hypothetical protein